MNEMVALVGRERGYHRITYVYRNIGHKKTMSLYGYIYVCCFGRNESSSSSILFFTIDPGTDQLCSQTLQLTSQTYTLSDFCIQHGPRRLPQSSVRARITVTATQLHRYTVLFCLLWCTFRNLFHHGFYCRRLHSTSSSKLGCPDRFHLLYVASKLRERPSISYATSPLHPFC